MNDSQPVFYLREPAIDAIPVVVTIPHTGVVVPKKIASNFVNDDIAALPMTDWHLHELYDFLPALGITTLYANYSRFVVDLNRSPDSEPLYPGRFETGLVATKTFDGNRIWKADPDQREIKRRRETFHDPYHRKLNELLSTIRDRDGRAFVVDAHSVVSMANSLHGPLDKEIYLGNRDGQTCDASLMGFFADAFAAQGLTVSRNYPYKGGYTTEHYGRQDRVSALQIEMCQRVYMDEFDPGGALSNDKFLKTKQILSEIFEKFCEEYLQA